MGVGRTVKISLPQGFVALIDTSDREKISRYKWHIKRSSKTTRIYAQTTIRLTPGRNGKKTSLSLHRYIMDAELGEILDHINGDPLDNRRANLRFVTARENSMNVVSSKHQKNGGFKGVTWHKRGKKWEAYIAGGEVRSNGKRKRLYLGLFKDKTDAALTYDEAAREHFGEFASTNFTAEEWVEIGRRYNRSMWMRLISREDPGDVVAIELKAGREGRDSKTRITRSNLQFEELLEFFTTARFGATT